MHTVADTSDATGRWDLIEMQQHQVIQVVLLGVVLGVATWLLKLLIKQIIFVPLFCGDPASSSCVNAPDTAANVSAVVVAIVGLMGLVRLSIYRPLIIALGVLVSLWGIGGWTVTLEWYEQLAWFVLLYALCYVTFAWLVRPRAFAPMLILVVVAHVLIRLLPLL